MALPKLNQIESKNAETTSKNKTAQDPFAIRTTKAIRDEIANNLRNKFEGTSYLTSKILKEAPADFFNKYDKIVADGVSAVQETMSQQNQSSIIAEAQANPSDKVKKRQAWFTINTEINKFLDRSRTTLVTADLDSEVDKKIISAMIANEIIGLGPLEPLWNDTDITEIIANGPYDIQIEIAGRVYKVRACHFRDADALDDKIKRLYQAINKNFAPTTPLVKGRLYDKSRMMAVNRIIAPDGPNFNIRRHSDEYLGPQAILDYGTANKELLTYIGNLIYNGVSFLVVGGTSSGKTTLLDALTAFFRPDARVITLEDNLEMKPHPKKYFAAAMECVDGKPGANGQTVGGVTMRDLVKASLQMRPEGLIIGEVTDAAAYDLCQALNTGHWGASTVHANTPDDAMYRLMSLVSQSDLIKGEVAYNLIAAAFDVIITTTKFPNDGSRKIISVSEVGEHVKKDKDGNNYLPTIPLWEFVPAKETWGFNDKIVGDWKQIRELSEQRQANHFLQYKPKLSWEQLMEVAKY